MNYKACKITWIGKTSYINLKSIDMTPPRIALGVHEKNPKLSRQAAKAVAKIHIKGVSSRRGHV